MKERMMKVGFEKIRDVIRMAEKSQEPLDISVLSGYSGKNIVRTLQKLCQLYETCCDGCYLEIGVFQGLTLLSAAQSAKETACYGIDNFQFFDPEGENLRLVNERKRKLGINNAHVIESDYEDALEHLNEHISHEKVNVYFIDGPHDYRSQLMCLKYILPYLNDEAVIIVDDCNYAHVRQANRDFLATHQDFKLLFESYTACHPHNMNSEERKKAIDGWWNGVNIIVRDPGNQLAPMLPPTERSRILFENDHVTHASRIAHLAPAALDFFNYIFTGKLIKAARAFTRAFLLYVRTRKSLAGRYDNMNTYSQALPTSRYNKQLEPSI